MGLLAFLSIYFAFILIRIGLFIMNSISGRLGSLRLLLKISFIAASISLILFMTSLTSLIAFSILLFVENIICNYN